MSLTDLQRAALEGAYENARVDVQAMVPAGVRRVLDLGCSSGALGAALAARDGAKVVGVELDPELASRAAERLERVVVADLDELAAREDLAADLGSFDCLIAADVLEHLRDPWTVLARLTSLVEPGGAVVMSLPNVRYWETFWMLGRHGTFPKAGVGLFDRTHLRWFTLYDAIGLLDQAGVDYEAVSREMRVGRHYREGRRRIHWLLEHSPVRAFFTYQHVVRGRRR